MAQRRPARLDTVVTLLNLAACFAYLYAATGVVYGTQGGVRIVTSFALSVAVGVIVLAYRFFLFWLALSTV